MKDPEKSCAQSHESYIKNQEKSCANSAARSRESYKNDLERRVTMIVLHEAVSIGIGTEGLKGPVPAQYFAMC